MPKIGVGEASATTLALILHELATNSLKYGALSATTGMLDVSCADDPGDVVLVWTERGGPPVVAPPQASGYGSKLVKNGMSGQLGGSIGFNWSEEGAIITLRINRMRLAT